MLAAFFLHQVPQSVDEVEAYFWGVLIWFVVGVWVYLLRNIFSVACRYFRGNFGRQLGKVQERRNIQKVSRNFFKKLPTYRNQLDSSLRFWRSFAHICSFPVTLFYNFTPNFFFWWISFLIWIVFSRSSYLLLCRERSARLETNQGLPYSKSEAR
jgi:hypothetical protein